jgi:hypothetical protein
VIFHISSILPFGGNLQRGFLSALFFPAKKAKMTHHRGTENYFYCLLRRSRRSK